MRKQKFLSALKRKLSGLPKQDVEESLNFYSEMIDDRMEEGRTEEEAVLAVGSIDDIVLQIMSEGHLPCGAGKPLQPHKGVTAWEITLLIVGFPVWFPLLMCFLAVIVAFFAVIWSFILSMWALEIPFLIFSFISKSLLLFCKKSTKCAVLFTKFSINGITNTFLKGKQRQ